MNRLFVLALPALLAGCSYKSASIPGAPLPFASVDYKVMGEVKADACGSYVFGIDFAHLFKDKQGGASGGGGADPLSAILGMLPIGGTSPEAGRALYKALDDMPEATNLYAPRINEKVTGFAPFGMPIFGERCAEVTAHGVQIGKGPVPNAN